MRDGGRILVFGACEEGPGAPEFRDMLVSVREKVADLKNQGKSLDEVVAAKPTANYDAKWGGFVIDGNFFTRLVYAGV